MSLLSPEVESTYEILEKMAEGGMGAVYKVRHRVFNDICVIKVMLANLERDPQLRKRFENEARKGKELAHPNIARVLNFAVGSNGNAYLVMEYIGGQNLRELRERRGVIDPATAISLTREILSALSCLHGHNLVHRDISPDNIMVVRNATGAMTVKLIDLGIAKSLDVQDGTRIGSFIGKPMYAAPEQFGETVDARTDLYSLGIMLYELLTGMRPIQATSFNGYAIAHYSTPPLPFEQSDPDGRVPQELRAIVMRSLEKQPGRRFQTAAEFSAALAPAQPAPDIVPPDSPRPSGQPIPQPPEIVSQLTSRQSYWRLAGVLIMPLLLGTAGYAVFTMRPSLKREQKIELGGIIRKIVDEGRPPSTHDPAIVAFMTRNDLSADDVQPFAIEFATTLRDSAKQIDRGKVAVSKGDVREAYVAFAEAKRIDPDSTFAWTNYGAAAMLLGKQAEATEAYQRALTIDPDNWLAHYNLGCQLARAGRMDDALEQLRMAVTAMKNRNTPAEIKSNLRKIREDEALQELHDDPRFETILAAR